MRPELISLLLGGVFISLASQPGVAASQSSSAHSMDWPRFRGANGSGVSEAKNLPIEFGTKTNVAWRMEVSFGVSSPVISGGRVFLTEHDGERGLIECFELQTGRRLWRRSVEPLRLEKKSKPNDATSSTPVTDGRDVYALFSGFGLIAFSVTGEERWRKLLGPFNPPHGMASSPILADERVIIVADQVSDSFIAAFDAATGKEKWRTPRGNFVGGYATPVLLGRDVVVSGPVEMIGYSAMTGKRLWSVPRMGVMPVGSPVCDGNRVFAYNGAVPPFESLARDLKGDRNGDGKLEPDEFPDPSFKEAVLAIDRSYGNGDGAVDQKEWDGALRLMNTMNTFVAAEVSGLQATELWRNTKLLADSASPLLYDGVLYLVRNGGILSSVDPGTGTVIRQERIAGFEGNIFASPVAADGKIYLLNSVGQLAVVSAGREWHALNVNELGEAGYSTPALVDDMIVVRTEHSLWAFRKGQ